MSSALNGRKPWQTISIPLGAFAKIHICGNISAILEEVIRTGTDIIDIDHRVDSVTEAAALLLPGRSFQERVIPYQ